MNRRLLLLGFFLLLPGPVGAQAGGREPTPPRVGSTATLLLKGGNVAGTERFFLGGWGGLVFGDRFVLGGGGVALTQDVELSASAFNTGFDLGVGYGGLFFRYWREPVERVTSEVGLFLGAGHAEVRDRLIGREEASDNFFVLEPEVSLFFALLPTMHFGVSGGYRVVWGVDDLPLVSAEDLRSFTGSLSLRLRIR